MRRRLKREGGFIISLEVVFLSTMMIAMLVIAWGVLVPQIVAEFEDIGDAIGSLNQSYYVTGMEVVRTEGEMFADTLGSQYTDLPDIGGGVIYGLPPVPEGVAPGPFVP